MKRPEEYPRFKTTTLCVIESWPLVARTELHSKIPGPKKTVTENANSFEPNISEKGRVHVQHNTG